MAFVTPVVEHWLEREIKGSRMYCTVCLPRTESVAMPEAVPVSGRI